MLRTIFMVGLVVMLGLFALKLVFNVLPMVVGLLLYFLGLALKIAVLGAVVYFLVRIFSPETARRWREKWSGSSL